MQMPVEVKLFGLLAHPAQHSLSPLMHNAAFHACQLPYHYQAFDVPPDQLEEAIKAIKLLNIKGVNVTVPHKEKIIPFLDQINEEAKAIGAVNTIVNENGSLHGYNTDGDGYVQSLIQETTVDLHQASIIILGAGGAAKGIAIYLLKNGCRHLMIANRSPLKAEQLEEQLQAYSTKLEHQVEIRHVPWQKAAEHCEAADVIINTTSVGLWPHVTEMPVQLKEISLKQKVVSDIIYNPLMTAFLQEAKSKGAEIHTGVGMFIYQGARAFRLFTLQEPPVEVMKQVVMHHLQRSSYNQH